jgi:hypothetical protein
VQTAKLLAADARPGDLFGLRVAVSADTLAVAALGQESGRGAVHLFERTPASSWVEARS